MEMPYSWPWNEIAAALLLLIGGVAARRGMRRLTSGLRHARSLDIIRGIRSSVIALAALAFAGGVLLAQTGLLVLGVVFLGEELYETGLLAAIIRAGERAEGRARGASPDQGRICAWAAKVLDAYGLAMRTLAVNTQRAEGRSLEAAQSFAANKEAWARQEALDAFTASVKELIGGK